MPLKELELSQFDDEGDLPRSQEGDLQRSMSVRAVVPLSGDWWAKVQLKRNAFGQRR